MCLLWKGNFRKRDYKESDVELLRQTVAKHIDRPFRFYCLTNDMNADIPAEKIELLHDWPGWWSKVELFRPDLPCGRTLYLDLDTHIIKGLQPILDTQGDLVMFPSPELDKKGNVHINTKDGLKIVKYQAGTMLFTPGKLTWVYDKFRKDADRLMNKYRSEQDIYADWLPHQPTFKREWITKINTVIKRKTVNNKTIVVTGNPKNMSFRNPDPVPWLDKIARE
jgi:hypothetical protein